MLSVQTQFLFVPSPEAVAALRRLVKLPGRRRPDGTMAPPGQREVNRAADRLIRGAGIAAFREIANAAKGLEIAHIQFEYLGLTLAASSRVRSSDGVIEIEAGIGDPRLKRSAFTSAMVAAALAASRQRNRDQERMRRRR